ncbi:MAG: sulfite exporter TauE/SafE family protein [Thaumarchaeota archaeon]|nr:sulfite exporter TauE/SafE family protein [Nitrososphaerota archaeon]
MTEDKQEVRAKDRLASRSGTAASVVYGSLIGFLAGLVGLGGAELRIPFILYYLDMSLDDMIVVNLLTSLAASSFNLAARLQAGIWSSDATVVSAAMIVGSLPGAYAGATLSHRVTRRALKGFIATILTFVVARVAFGLIFPPGKSQGAALVPELFLSILTGFGVGIISGAVGVAGGEYRIPVLTYVLGFPIKIAGSVSQLVTLPTTAVSLLRHRRFSPFSKRALRGTLVLGVPSVAGGVLSGLLVASVPVVYIELLFALILSYTVLRIVWELAGRN